MTQVVFINGRVATATNFDGTYSSGVKRNNVNNTTNIMRIRGRMNSSENFSPCPAKCYYNSRSTNSKIDFTFSTALYVCVFVLLSFCTIGGLTSPDTPTESISGNDTIRLQRNIRDFLESHCNKINQTLEQKEFENFISCNPTQAATTFKRLKDLKEVDSSNRHIKIQMEINKQCDVWPQEKSCQKKNFALIQKCFLGQQKFVFYFMLALTDTICKDGELFIDYWEKGGDACLQDHLKQLTREVADCFKITSTMTDEELDRNIRSVSSCIGKKFRICGSAESAQVIDNLLSEIEMFYDETKNADNYSASQSLYPMSIVMILSSFIFTITQHALLR